MEKYQRYFLSYNKHFKFKKYIQTSATSSSFIPIKSFAFPQNSVRSSTKIQKARTMIYIILRIPKIVGIPRKFCALI